MKKRFLALILCLVMVIGLVPTVFAAEGDPITVAFAANLSKEPDEHGPVVEKQFVQGAESKTEDAIPVPSGKAGYHFVGWSRVNKDKTALFTFGTDKYPTEDTLTLYAIWELDSVETDTFTVTYRTPDSVFSTSSQVNKGDRITVQGCDWPAPEGMTFGGWQAQDGKTYKQGDVIYNVQSDWTFVAVFTQKSESALVRFHDYDKDGAYTRLTAAVDANIKLYLNGGSYLGTADVIYGDEAYVTVTGNENVQTIADAEKSGVTFAGWKLSEEDGMIALTAMWKDTAAVKYKVYFDDYDDACKYLELEKDSTFVVDPNGGSVKFEGETFSIVKAYTVSKNYTLADAARDDYRFLGWDVTNYGTKTIFTAMWAKISSTTYTIKYWDYDTNKYAYETVTSGDSIIIDPNGGSVKWYGTTISSKKTITSIRSDRILDDATRTGYTFYGWDLTYSGGKPVFTAMWSKRIDTVPYMLNGVDHYAYIKGYPNGTFKPDATITRAEVSTIFYRLLTDSTRKAYTTSYNTFKDVPANAWYNTAVSTMAKLGIITGGSDGYFRPNDPITRAEMAAMIARCDGGYYSSTYSGFTDINGHWASSYIARAYELGWITGYGSTYAPDRNLSRAESVAILNRVLNRAPQYTSDLLKNMTTFSDVGTNAWYYLDVQEAANSHTYTRRTNGYESWDKLTTDPNWM